MPLAGMLRLIIIPMTKSSSKSLTIGRLSGISEGRTCGPPGNFLDSPVQICQMLRMKPSFSKVVGTGSYLPDKVLRNEDLKQFPPPSIALIAEKTGVRERRHAAEGESTSDLAARAGLAALTIGKLNPADLECIVLATSSPDRFQPATATRVQQLLGATRAFAFDVNSVCTGGVYALAIADSFIQSGFCRNALVIAAEVYSRFLNPQDISTYPYFGDGAGAILLGTTQGERGIPKIILKTDGGGAEVIQVPGGGSMKPFAACNLQDVFFRMRGREVFQFAITKGAEVIEELLSSTGLAKDAIACVITHQANINIISEISQRIAIPKEKFFVNLERYGNTAAASVFIALDEALAEGAAKQGDYVIMAAFGGGLSWGASLIKL
jgi:3-oxoacyl-[acyl-carrier-protein] synthase III